MGFNSVWVGGGGITGEVGGGGLGVSSIGNTDNNYKNVVRTHVLLISRI